jgi:hypothetical protein
LNFLDKVLLATLLHNGMNYLAGVVFCHFFHSPFESSKNSELAVSLNNLTIYQYHFLFRGYCNVCTVRYCAIHHMLCELTQINKNVQLSFAVICTVPTSQLLNNSTLHHSSSASASAKRLSWSVVR